VNILVLNGPNLNLLGEREPTVYGTGSLADLERELRARAEKLNVTLRLFQSNHEGELIDRLHQERRWMDGLIINPGAFTHTSYALQDAIRAVGARAVEVHLSDISKREAFRRVSRVRGACEAQISGGGFQSYFEALEKLAGVAIG
jgi:3-dehydroquinate dehydratase-2